MKLKKAMITTLCLGLLASAAVGATAIGASAEVAGTPSANLATSADNWGMFGNVNASNASFSGAGMTIGNAGTTTAMVLGNKIKADSKVDLTLTGNSPSSTWGGYFVALHSGETVDAAAPVKAVNENTPAGDWIGFYMVGGVGAYVVECNDGTLTKMDVASWANASYCNPSPVSGYDWFYPMAQTNTVSVETTDTDTGVTIVVNFAASGSEKDHGDGNTGNTDTSYTFTYSSTNTDLKGDHALSVGTYYDNSPAGANWVLSSLTATAKNAGESALVPNAENAYENFATSLDFFRGGANVGNFTFDASGATPVGVTNGGLVLNHKVPDNTKVSLAINGTHASAGWCNLFVGVKQSEETLPFDNVTPQQKGDWIVFQFGSDGLFVKECVNSGTPTSTAIFNGAYNYQMYAYNQGTQLSYTAKDVADGIEITFTLVGSDGVLRTDTYKSTNTALKGEQFSSVSYGYGAASSATANIKITKWTIDGVTEGFVSDINVSELMTKLNRAQGVVVTALNVDEYTALAEEAANAYYALNYTQLQEYQKPLLNKLNLALKNYNDRKDDVAAVVAKIEALSATVTASNYEDAKADYEAAELSYDTLDSLAKEMVHNADKLDTVREAIEAYESGLENGDNTDGGNTDNGDNGGCGASVAGVPLVLCAVGLGAFLVKKARKED